MDLFQVLWRLHRAWQLEGPSECHPLVTRDVMLAIRETALVGDNVELASWVLLS